jgi:GTP-binding protein
LETALAATDGGARGKRRDDVKFVDLVEIEVEAGDGGRGCVAFRREKFVPKGGPSGGDGGDGGNVVFRVDPHLRTLLALRYSPRVRAKRGGHGGGSNKTGAHGSDMVVGVPEGTEVYDGETGELIADLTEEAPEAVVARGGEGGRGNARFKSSTDRAPRHAEPGRPGEKHRLRLELKLLADAGLVGLPNAGKSSLLARVSKARPKIADYPFTTLTPSLGIVSVDERTSFVMADIPGLIEGAGEGKGLGHAFLRHVERTRVLVYLIDASNPDPADDYATVKREVEGYDPRLAERPRLVALNKCDLLGDREPDVELPGEAEVHHISAVTGRGVDGLVGAIANRLELR